MRNGPKPVTMEEQFWSKVEIKDGCWGWKGHLSGGRGEVAYGGGKRKRAYVVSWIIHRGPVPNGMVVRHKCDNPTCANPEHLVLGLQADNVRDMHERGRASGLFESGHTPKHAGKFNLKCGRGHARRERSNGQYYCPTCQNDARKLKRLEMTGI